MALFCLLATAAFAQKSAAADSLYRLGAQLSKEGKPAEAVLFFEKTIESAGLDDTLRARALHQLGLCRYRESRYAEATAALGQARELFKKTLGASHRDHIACLNSLGFLLNVQARYPEAERALQEARQLCQRAGGGGEDLLHARVLTNLAGNFADLNRSEQAAELFTAALVLKEKKSGRRSRDYATTLYNLASFEAGLGRDAAAHTAIEEGIATLTALGDTTRADFWKFLDFRAILAERGGRAAEAERAYREALARREANGAAGGDDHALNLFNLGHFLEKEGRHAEAAGPIVRTLPFLKKIYGEGHPTYAAALTTLAETEAELGDGGRARAHFEEAARAVEKTLGRSHIAWFDAQFALARFLRKEGKAAEAAAIFLKIEKTPRDYLRRAARFLSEKELSEKTAEYRAFAEEVFSALRQSPDDAALAGLAYDCALFYRGFVLENLQRTRQAILRARAIGEARDEAVALHRQLDNELNRPLAERAATAPIERRIGELEAGIARAIGSFSEKKEAESAWADVQNALGEGEAAVEFLAFTDRLAGGSAFYAALVLTKSAAAPAFAPLCTEAELSPFLPADGQRRADYVGRVYGPSGRGATALKPGQRPLADLVWRPVAGLLGGASRAFIAPDGLLNRFALGALPTGLETVVADSIELVTVGSTRQVLPDDGRIVAFSSKKALVVSGIDYEKAGGAAVASRSDGATSGRPGPWADLPFAEKEGQEVAGLLKKSGLDPERLTGAAATETALTGLLEKGGWRALHVATHGFFSEKTGEAAGFYTKGMANSGLALAGANGPADGRPASADGLLTAHELAQLDLSATELVVLSACETALGDIEGGEGVQGLQRAFRLAGAQHLVMSLWQVPDRETREFMGLFYEKWAAVGDVRSAFRAAQKEMRSRRPDPFHWAGFVLLE